jgi:hypothetical protein
MSREVARGGPHLEQSHLLQRIPIGSAGFANYAARAIGIDRFLVPATCVGGMPHIALYLRVQQLFLHGAEFNPQARREAKSLPGYAVGQPFLRQPPSVQANA